MFILIDNYDSFTYNLYHYLGEIGAEVEVFRNDEISVEELKEKARRHELVRTLTFHMGHKGNTT